MQWLDIFILVPLTLATYLGLREGLLAAMGDLMAVVFAFLATFYALPYVGDTLSPYFPSAVQSKTYLINFVFLFFVFLFGSYYGLRYIAQKGLVKIQMQGLDKVLGAVVGFLRAALVIAGLVFLIENIDTRHWLLKKEQKKKAQMYQIFLQAESFFLKQLRSHRSLYLLKKEWIDDMKL